MLLGSKSFFSTLPSYITCCILQSRNEIANMLECLSLLYPLLSLYFVSVSVCLQKLKDNENALLAFERSTSLMKPNMKSPLVYLNSAIFSYQMGKTESAAINFNNFVEESKEFVLSTEVNTFLPHFCVL